MKETASLFDAPGQEPLRHPHRALRFVVLASLPGLSLVLLTLLPSGRALLGITARDALGAALCNAVVVGAAMLEHRRRGGQSRLYRALAAFEALVLQGTTLWLVWRSGRGDSPLYLVSIVLAAINVRFTEHTRVLRLLLLLPPAALSLAFALGRHDVAAALLALSVGGFAQLVFEAGMRANLRLRQVLREREALEERIAAMRLHDERTRIARELHDGLGAELSALMWRAERIRARLGAGHHEELGSLIERAGFGIDELRTVVWALRAPSTTWEALSSYVRDRVNELCAGRLELTFSVDEAGSGGRSEGGDAIDGELAIDVIRVTQEAVRNALRHARAGRLHVGLRGADPAAGITITVEDDGAGVPSEALGRDRGGIANLRQRAEARGGSSTVERREEGGTRVRVSLPRGSR